MLAFSGSRMIGGHSCASINPVAFIGWMKPYPATILRRSARINAAFGMRAGDDFQDTYGRAVLLMLAAGVGMAPLLQAARAGAAGRRRSGRPRRKPPPHRRQ